MPDETREPAKPPEQWNLLVTAREGAARDLRRFVRRQAVFHPAPGFRNVLLGWHRDPQQFLRDLATSLEEKPFAHAWLGRVLPMQVSFPVELGRFSDDLLGHLAGLVDGLRNRSFHVRVERRGHKHQVRTQELEQLVGDYLWEQLQRRGVQPVVTFRDPDVIVAIEIVGPTAGIGIISRQLRSDFPFVKLN